MMKCLCGCNQEIDDSQSRGNPRRYYSNACKQRRYNRNKSKDNRNIDMSLLNQIVTGDCRELAKTIPDGSIDLIFTDPPYPKEYLPLYGWLAKEAARVLKPCGFLLTYSGNMYLHEVMMSLGQHLTYFWSYIALDSGQGTIVWPRKTVARHKAILAYCKGMGKPRCNTLDVWNGSGKDKRYHAWGQDVTTARYYIDCFSRKGDTLLEPFTGGGTTCIAAKLIDRNYVGFELASDQADIARKRLETMQMPLMNLSANQLSLESEVSA